jgi:hypothetical protein
MRLSTGYGVGMTSTPPGSATDRTIAIAALHAVTQGFVTDEVVPMPTIVSMSRHDLTVSQLLWYAALYGQIILSGGESHWINVRLTAYELHSIDVTLKLFGTQAYQMDDADKALIAQHNDKMQRALDLDKTWPASLADHPVSSEGAL